MNKFNFDIVIKELQKAKVDLPKQLANISKKYFLDSWKNQGWEGHKWKTPKRQIPGTPEYKYPKKGASDRHSRAILIGKGSGALRRAVNNSIKEQTFNIIRFEVNVDYAKIHNEGGIMKNGKRMPQRQFMPVGNINPPALTKMQKEKIDFVIGKIWGTYNR